MPFAGNIGDFLGELKRYAFGRGLLTTATLMATGISMAFGWGVILPALAITVGGTLLTAYNSLARQRAYEENMVSLYRDDIAAELGIAPGDVTRADVKEAAKTNEVLGQALDRQRDKTLINIGTAALSSAATLAMVFFFGVDGSSLHGFAVEHLGKIMGPLANLIGIGTVASLTGLVLHDGLKALIGHHTGTNKAAAHDMIMSLSYERARGHAVQAEQVYAVLVASDAELAARILQQSGHDYRALNSAQQRSIMQKIGVGDAMQQLADDINTGRVNPGHLAYMLGEEFTSAHPEQTAVHCSNFVERLGLAPRAQHSHAHAINAAREAVIAGHHIA